MCGRRFHLVACGHDDVSAGSRQRRCRCQTEATVGAGHDRDTTSEVRDGRFGECHQRGSRCAGRTQQGVVRKAGQTAGSPTVGRPCKPPLLQGGSLAGWCAPVNGSSLPTYPTELRRRLVITGWQKAECGQPARRRHQPLSGRAVEGRRGCSSARRRSLASDALLVDGRRTEVMSLLPGRPDLAASVRFAGMPRSCRFVRPGERAVDILPRYRPRPSLPLPRDRVG